MGGQWGCWREDAEDEEEEMEGRSQHSEEIAVADWSVFCLAYQPVVCCICAPTSLNALCFLPALPFLSRSFLNMILFGSPTLFVKILFERLALFTRFFHCCVHAPTMSAMLFSNDSTHAHASIAEPSPQTCLHSCLATNKHTPKLQ